MIPYGRQDITEEDVAAVAEALRSDFLTQGPRVPSFEAAVAEATGAAHAVAVNSATSALHVACLALGLGPGDLLWTQPITFVASANVGHLCGAEVDFVDIDPVTFTMCPERLAEKLDEAEASGRLPKIVMPVHMCGQPADMEAIGALCRARGVRVIEDASHAIGAHDGTAPTGACAHSDVAVFSFHPVKIVTTGEGGVATTQDAGLADAMRRLASHGVTRDPELMEGESEGGWYYEQIGIGLNYRMTDIAAALGESQMARLDDYVARRNEIASRYHERLAGLPLERPAVAEGRRSSFHLYVIRVAPDRRRDVYDRLRDAGIGVNVHYIPVHLQPYWQRHGFGPGDFPAAEAYYAGAISIPLHPGLTPADEDAVVGALEEALA